jgi:hypothetical protein
VDGQSRQRRALRVGSLARLGASREASLLHVTWRYDLAGSELLPSRTTLRCRSTARSRSALSRSCLSTRACRRSRRARTRSTADQLPRHRDAHSDLSTHTCGRKSRHTWRQGGRTSSWVSAASCTVHGSRWCFSDVFCLCQRVRPSLRCEAPAQRCKRRPGRRDQQRKVIVKTRTSKRRRNPGPAVVVVDR